MSDVVARFRWLEGRQGSGYRKLLLWAQSMRTSSREGRWWSDAWIIHYPPGAGVPPHRDRVGDGEKHYRVNIVLVQPKGGRFEGETIVNLGGRFVLFCPDVSEHSVSPCEASRYVLSLGFVVPRRRDPA